VACKSSAAERSAVRAAALRQGRHGKREQSDCGAEVHEAILRLIEILFLRRQTGPGCFFPRSLGPCFLPFDPSGASN
jgi:hypothetical protein